MRKNLLCSREDEKYGPHEMLRTRLGGHNWRLPTLQGGNSALDTGVSFLGGATVALHP